MKKNAISLRNRTLLFVPRRQGPSLGRAGATALLGPGNRITTTTAFGGVMPCCTAGAALVSRHGCGVLFTFTP